MAINAISGLFGSSYSTKQIDTEYEEIKKQLMAMGLEPSGSKTADKVKLNQAIKEKELEEAQKANSSSTISNAAQTEETEETDELTETYKNILTELGVTQTDDVEYDYDQAIKQIESKLKEAADPYEQSRLLSLKSRLDYEVNSMGYSVQSLSSSAMTGATAMGEMNKQMLVSSGSFNSSGK